MKGVARLGASLALALTLLAPSCGDPPPEADRHDEADEAQPEAEPSPLDAHLQTFAACYQKKDYGCAVQEASAAVEIAPERRETFTLVSQTFVEAGWDAEAVTLFAELTERFPARAEPWFFKGVHEARLKKLEDAAASFASAAKLAPADAEVHFRLAQTLEQLNRKQAALEELRRAHELDPASSGKAASLMTALSVQGKSAEADQVAATLLAAAPASAEAHFSVAQLRMRESKWAEAEALLTRALELDPRFGPAAADLDRLRKLAPAR